MTTTRGLQTLAILLTLGISSTAADKEGHKKDALKTANGADAGPAILWRDPADISSRNLFYGPGGKKDEPRGSFTFVEEDLDGTNPKIVVKDQDGVKWTVKMGAEARPETAATRLNWAIGYFANEDYFLHDLKVENLPAHLRRGQKFVASDGTLHDVRLKRHLEGEKKVENWAWRQDKFTGTQELNGLRVMMAVMNNWDLTDENNGVYSEKGSPEQMYMVSDLGSTFGSGRLSWPLKKGRGDLSAYKHSKFITRMNSDTVDFFVPTRPSFFYIFTPHEFANKLRLRWIGKQIPRRDAKWLGEQLGRLSAGQVRDAFRAAGYSPQEIDAFAAVIQARISALQEL